MDMVAAQGESISDWMTHHGIPILVIVAIAVAVTIVARILVRRFQRRLGGSPDTTQTIDLRRAATLTHALSTTALVLIWIVAFFLVLDQLGVNIAPLLASAGVAGVALGFGAQNVVGDTLAGFFILLENQYGVGDVIELQPAGTSVAGRVEALTLRVTTLRSYDGTLHVVPNGKVAVVSNRSRGWARAIVDIPVAYDEDYTRVRDALEELFEELRTEPSMRDWVHDGPTVLGVENLSAGYAQQVRVIAETRPSKRLDVERLLRERITGRLAERGIRAPAPPPAPPV